MILNNDLSNIIKEILRNDIESLDELYSIIDNDFIELIKIINKTKGIFFLLE